MNQQTIIIIVIIVAVLMAMRWFYKSMKAALEGRGKCSGCAFYDACEKKKKHRCAEKKTISTHNDAP